MSIGETTAFRWRMGPIALLVTATLWLTILEFSCLSVTAQFSAPSNVSCACPNQNLTFNCTVMGDGSTVWGGSAFSCDQNSISLRHLRFADGTNGTCNLGAIIAQSVGNEGDRYTSQLTVIVSSEFDNDNVTCSVDSTTGLTLVGEAVVTVISGPHTRVLSNVQLTNVKPKQLTFSWSTICSSINYAVSSNCTTWSCVVTDTTTAVCSASEVQLPSVCTFTVSIQTEVCGQVGLPSEPIRVTLRVPDTPIVTIVPVYSANGLRRLQATIEQQAYFNIADGVLGSTTFYSVSYNTARIMKLNQSTSCEQDVCQYSINVPSDLCQSSSNISIALSATNDLGQGNFSDPMTIGCNNQFVQVEYDKTTRTITCRFLDETETSVKLCNVTYGQCGQEPVQTRRLGNFSTMTNPNIVYLRLSDSLECYNVTASSDVFTVIVEGNTSENGSGGLNVASIAVIIIIVILALIVSVTSIIVIAVFVIKRKKGNSQNKVIDEIGLADKHKSIPESNKPHSTIETGKVKQVESSKTPQIEASKNEQVKPEQLETLKKDNKAVEEVIKAREEHIEEVKVFTIEADAVIDVEKLRVLKTLNMADYKRFTISDASELREFIEEQSLEFKRRQIFYEFQHSFESISEDQELLTLDTDHRELLSQLFSQELCGHRVPKPKGFDSKLFVQNAGFSARHLPAGSMLLYKVQSESKTSTSSEPVTPPLKPIISSHFEMTSLTSKVTVEEFCEKKKISKEYSVLLELSTFVKKPDYVDVILFEKVTGFLFTGPTARSMVQKYYSNGVSPDLAKWRVFVLCQKYDMDLEPGTTILHQKQDHPTEKFHTLTVNENDGYMCMSDFVEKKLQLEEFTNGHAFYEFTKEEDLNYYKDVVHLSSSDDHQKVVQSSIDLFYRLPGVPAVEVKPSIMSGGRVFIQSTSQGARCVKPRDTILYKESKTT